MIRSLFLLFDFAFYCEYLSNVTLILMLHINVLFVAGESP